MRCFFKIMLISCFIVSGCQTQAGFFQRLKTRAATMASSGVAQLPAFGKYVAQAVVAQTLMQGIGCLRGPQKIEVSTATSWKAIIGNWIKRNFIAGAFKLSKNIATAQTYSTYVKYDDDTLCHRRCYMADEPERYNEIVNGPKPLRHQDPRFVAPEEEDVGRDFRRGFLRFAEETGSDLIMHGISQAVGLDSVNRMIDAAPVHPLARFGLKVALGTGCMVAREGIRKFALHPAVEFGKNARKLGFKAALRAMAIS